MRLETAPQYTPRRVGTDVLSQVIDLHFKAFVDHVEEQGGIVPGYVKQGPIAERVDVPAPAAWT